MAKRQVFYSFHYGNDVFRVQQVRNMGAIEENAPVSPSEWESIRQRGDAAITRWIDDNMKYRSCVVVLVGSETAHRPWVQHEITKAWNDGKGVLGVHIHNLRCPKAGTTWKGANPFDQFTLSDGRKLSSVVACYDPGSFDAYGEIKRNLGTWVERAIEQRS